MDLLAVAQVVLGDAVTLNQESGGLTINFFWIIVSALNFVFFLIVIGLFAFKPLAATLTARRARIEQGLKDADVARREREAAAEEKQTIVHEARREAGELIARAQKVAEELREREEAATRAELDRLREQAEAQILADRERALAEVRGQIADLALRAASVVVGETRTSERERRLVEQFLAQVGPTGRPEGT